MRLFEEIVDSLAPKSCWSAQPPACEFRLDAELRMQKIAACAPQYGSAPLVRGVWKSSRTFRVTNRQILPSPSVNRREIDLSMTRNQRRPKQQKLNSQTTTTKTKLTKIIMSSLAFACLLCLAAAMAPGTSATGGRQPAGEFAAWAC